MTHKVALKLMQEMPEDFVPMTQQQPHLKTQAGHSASMAPQVHHSGSQQGALPGPVQNHPASENSNSSSMQSAENQKMEDKRFPKCRLCNYRYFTRLDLCRHFVDYHLRTRLEHCLDPNSQRCPACALTYDKTQSRLRHFIWSHQDLEGLVVQDAQVRLSEFMPSLRDLEIVRQKNELRMRSQNQTGNTSGEPEVNKIEFKDITDLAALPVSDAIDVKLQHPFCELCGEEFKNSVNKARDKSSHLMGHFREDIMKDLPNFKPFNCPKCTFVGRDSQDLARHYGLNHKVSLNFTLNSHMTIILMI